MIRIRQGQDNDKTMKFLYEMPVNLTRAIRRSFSHSGKKLVDGLRKDIKLPKSGRQYKVYLGIGGKTLKKSRLHRASSSKETPAIITGSLRKSVDFAVRGNRALEFGANQSAPEYAQYLEKGTSKMKAREPFKKTIIHNKEKIKADIDIELKKVLSGKK